MGFSERIKEIRKLMDVNQSEFATKIGVSRSIVSEFESGTREPSKDFLLSLHSAGVSIDWFLTGSGEPLATNRLNTKPFAVQFIPTKKLNNYPDTKSLHEQVIQYSNPDNRLVIPFLDQPVSAGNGENLEDEAFPDRFITVPKDLVRYPSLKALPVKGDSMSPLLHEGDLVVCDSGGWDGDGIYVIKTQECAYVKRVILTSKGYTVVSDNKAYPSYSESKDDMHIVGKVRCAVVQVK